MITIKPSDGLIYARKSVIVEGKIAGAKVHTETRGGRWVVSVSDLNSPAGRSDAVLAVNEKPEDNPPVLALGVTAPNQAIVKLFGDESFERLFLPGTSFRAEAVVGVLDGQVWLNVSQIIMFEPQFMIGTRQVYNEPICQRRLLLRARGIKGKRIGGEVVLAGPFVGNLLHSTFQEIVTSENREASIAEFKKEPKKFLLRAIQPEAVLIGAMGLLGDEPRLDGSEWNAVKNQIERLLDSESVKKLLDLEPRWFSEVPVSGRSIRGYIDLRSPSRILELKAGTHRPSDDNQLSVYLIGEMLEYGFSTKDGCEAYLLYGGQVPDNLRVQKLSGDSPQLKEALERFLLARHRLLLVSSGKMLPKIELDPANCKAESCEYYLSEPSCGSACHFYCQTERNWSCEGCKHSSKCTEHSKLHAFEVLDEANRIRTALNMEIEHQQARHFQTAEINTGSFQILHSEANRILVLKLMSGCAFDLPSPGEKITLKYEDCGYPASALMAGVDEDGKWTVINRGPTLGLIGSTVQVAQQRSELNGIYHLLACVDELQRLGDVSNRDGICFAGGSIVSNRLAIAASLEGIFSDVSVTDIFCQSFDLKTSKELLRTVLGKTLGRVLIITDVASLSMDGGLDLRGTQLLGIASGSLSITDALTRVKNDLFQYRQWVISPDILLSSDTFRSLPRRGNEFFDCIVIYETNSITALEYFLIRQYGRRMVTIGDANSVGRPLRSSQAKLLGLGDNLMTRVYSRGFPKIEGKLNPRIVFPKIVRVSPVLNAALKSCRMISAGSCASEVTVDIISCDSGSHGSEIHLASSGEIDITDGGPAKELRLMMDELVSASEIENDLHELKAQISSMLVKNQQLITPTSGRSYTVIQAPGLRNDKGRRWLVQFYATGRQLGTSELEVDKITQKVEELRRAGVKQRNVAIMSASPKQLALIADRHGNKLSGIALRTPYGIRGETWGHVIISCASQTAGDVDARELYTMIRAGITRVYIIAESNVLKNHPFLRAMLA